MPIYDYECENPDCRCKLTVEQKISDAKLTDCPHCKRTTLKRLISGGGGFVLNGDGWFKKGGY